MEFMQELARRNLFIDGAMGTLLQREGLPAGELPERWNLIHPEVVLDIHRRYRAAGCDILTANTFGANALKLGGQAGAAIGAGVRLARQAADGQALVALDIGPTGKLMRPYGDLEFEQAVSLFGDMAAAGEAAGADLLLMETFSDTYEVKAAILGAKERTHLPIAVTLIFDERGKLLTGGDIAAAVALLEGLGVAALGCNCGLGPEQMGRLLPELLRCTSVPVIVTPNAGLPRQEGERTFYDVEPEAFASSVRTMLQAGARVAGGCCGTTPEHIAALTAMCRGLAPVPIVDKNRCVISSYGRALCFDGATRLIGERINPTGKKRFKQALREGDYDYILKEGIAQQENGAQALDVNVGLPELNEAAVMAETVTRLQAVTDLPLQIDTADPAAMERALRLYNGKPLINSVSGKAESMARVFPLVKKYGGVVVALALDDQGIPPTAQGRVEVARRIVEEAERQGIARKNLLLDALTLTASTDGDNARVTLEALRRIREQLKVHTVLGVSNISFGLPQRGNLNAAFLSMAMAAGLDAAILNPGSGEMMRAWRASLALLGGDARCEAYVAAYGQQAAPSAAPVAQAETTLREAVLRGLTGPAQAAAGKLLAEMPPLDIVSTQLIPALDEVGKGYETGSIFLPQLLMSADAAKAAFAVLQAALRDGDAQPQRDVVVLATVRGDVHDIGKNIVKVLLENYGFAVEDLGKDVPAERIVRAVQEKGARLVGLSALMTTTVPQMENTIRLLREQAPDCLVMVGGAVLTKEYAQRIGADFYGRDAMAAVQYAKSVYQR